MKKKTLYLLSVLLLSCTFAACSTDSDSSDTDDSWIDTDETDLSDMDVETEEELDITILTIYYPDADNETILAEINTFEQNTKLTETEVLEILTEYEVINPDIAFNSSYESQTEDNIYIMTLDLSDSFTDYLNSLEEDTQSLVMQCIANTFIDYYHMDELIVTVDGESLVTDYADYTKALLYSDTDISQTTEKPEDDQD